MMDRVTRTPAETEEVGRGLGAVLRAGDVVALVGELGSGKTQLVSGICAALGMGSCPARPSLIHEYPARKSVVHRTCTDLVREAVKRGSGVLYAVCDIGGMGRSHP
jgi:tRNA A37 threonylcarbamoyladenosine biosynthesis protein TsaE